MTAYYDRAAISPYFPLLSLYKPRTMAQHYHRVLHELLLAAIVAVGASSAQTNPIMGGHNLCAWNILIHKCFVLSIMFHFMITEKTFSVLIGWWMNSNKSSLLILWIKVFLHVTFQDIFACAFVWRVVFEMQKCDTFINHIFKSVIISYALKLMISPHKKALLWIHHYLS